MSFVCDNCQATIPPTAKACSHCGKEFSQSPISTQNEEGEGGFLSSIPDIPVPDPLALPPLKAFRIQRILLGIGLFILVTIIVVNIDRSNQFPKWKKQCITFFQDTDNWEGEYPQIPLVGNINPVLIPNGDSFLENQANLFIQELPIFSKKATLNKLKRYKRSTFRSIRSKEIIKNIDETYIIIEARNDFIANFFGVYIWTPNGTIEYNSNTRSIILEFIIFQVIALFVFFYFSRKHKESLITKYRRRQREAYNQHQEKRQGSIFQLKEKVEESKRLAQQGNIAEALIIIKSVLRASPNFYEAVEFKKFLLQSENISSPVLTVNLINKALANSSGEVKNLLYLRIVGTPYAYQAPEDLDKISIGRQRRKHNDEENMGNDIVIRVPGSAPKSLRISRNHLVIYRINREYYVQDLSGGCTLINGKKLSEEKPVKIISGDKLQIAGVFILEIAIRSPIVRKNTTNILQFHSLEENIDLSFEATLGDMLTEFHE